MKIKVINKTIKLMSDLDIKQDENKYYNIYDNKNNHVYYKRENKNKGIRNHIINNNSDYYDIKNDEKYIKRMNDKSPIKKYKTLKDFIDNFYINDKDNKKEIKKAIANEFKKEKLKVKINNGDYNKTLNIILEIKEKEILENDIDNIYNKAKNEYYRYDWNNLDRFYNLHLNKNISVNDKENINIIKEYLKDSLKLLQYSRYYVKEFNTKGDKKQRIEELFYKDDVLNKIKKTVKDILFKYSILLSYDAYSEYNSSKLTFNFEFYLKIV